MAVVRLSIRVFRVGPSTVRLMEPVKGCDYVTFCVCGDRSTVRARRSGRIRRGTSNRFHPANKSQADRSGPPTHKGASAACWLLVEKAEGAPQPDSNEIAMIAPSLSSVYPSILLSFSLS